VLGCLLSEYAVAAALAGGATLAVLGLRNSATGRSHWKPGVALIVAALIAYGVFRSTIHDGFRGDVAPGYLAGHFAQRVVSFPLFLVTSVWQAAFGAVLSRTGDVRIALFGMERATTAALVLGVAVCIAVARTLGSDQAQDDQARAAPASLAFFERIRTELALLAGIAAGFTPFCLTARVPADDASSRYFIPVLPLAAVLSLSLLTEILEARRLRRFGAAVLAGVSVYWSVTNAAAVLKDRHRVRQWSHELEAHVAKGPTLVILTSTTPWPPFTRNYELTARLRHDMRGAPSQHLWVAREIPVTDSELKLLPANAEARVPPRLSIGWYHVTRMEESLDRIVWASVGSDGKLAIVEEKF